MLLDVADKILKVISWTEFYPVFIFMANAMQQNLRCFSIMHFPYLLHMDSNSSHFFQCFLDSVFILSFLYSSSISSLAYLLVVYKGVHQQTLVNEFLPLWLLIGQITVVVVGDDDAIRLIGQFDDEAVIIANHTASLHTARWSEDQDLLFFQSS